MKKVALGVALTLFSALSIPYAQAESRPIALPNDTRLIEFVYRPNEMFTILTRPEAVTNIQLSDDVDLSVVARGTPGFAGADLANLVNEAALTAARADKKKVDMDDFNYAKDKVLMGAERKSMVMSDRRRGTPLTTRGATPSSPPSRSTPTRSTR